MSRRVDFRRNSEELGVLYTWWRRLEDLKGERAALRRAGRPEEVVFVPYYHELNRLLRGRELEARLPRLAAISGLVSHVEVDDRSASLPLQMAQPKAQGDLPRVRESRFRRLLEIDDDGDDRLYETLRRVLRLLDGVANLESLARGVYWWNQKTRREWAYDYYGALS